MLALLATVITISAALAPATVRGATTKWEVLGLHLGMSVDEAKTRLKELNASRQSVERGGKWTILDATFADKRKLEMQFTDDTSAWEIRLSNPPALSNEKELARLTSRLGKPLSSAEDERKDGTLTRRWEARWGEAAGTTLVAVFKEGEKLEETLTHPESDDSGAQATGPSSKTSTSPPPPTAAVH